MLLNRIIQFYHVLYGLSRRNPGRSENSSSTAWLFECLAMGRDSCGPFAAVVPSLSIYEYPGCGIGLIGWPGGGAEWWGRCLADGWGAYGWVPCQLPGLEGPVIRVIDFFLVSRGDVPRKRLWASVPTPTAALRAGVTACRNGAWRGRRDAVDPGVARRAFAAIRGRGANSEPVVPVAHRHSRGRGCRSGQCYGSAHPDCSCCLCSVQRRGPRLSLSGRSLGGCLDRCYAMGRDPDCRCVGPAGGPR